MPRCESCQQRPGSFPVDADGELFLVCSRCLPWTPAMVARSDRAAQRLAMVLMALFSIPALYAVLAVLGIVPAMPWSPMGGVQ